MITSSSHSLVAHHPGLLTTYTDTNSSDFHYQLSIDYSSFDGVFFCINLLHNFIILAVNIFRNKTDRHYMINCFLKFSYLDLI